MPIATASINYWPDVGVSSVKGIQAAAKTSGLVPPLQDTNDYDPPPNGGGFHLTGNAVDWSNGGDNGSPEMDKFAAWVAANYGPYSLEIIHVNQDGSTVEWKYGKAMPTGWYGQATLAQHKNHVHWAITNTGLQAGGNVTGDANSLGTSTAFSANPASWNPLDPSSWVKPFVNAIFKPLIDYTIDAGLVLGGGVLMLIGIFLLFKEFGIGQGAAATIKTAGVRAAEVAAVA